MTTSRILGTGRALPGKVLTNQDLERLVETSDDWIRERTGIQSRRVLEDGRVTSDLATEAARAACDAAGIAPTDLDCIVLATVTPDMPFPATAVSVQQKLGCKPGIPAFDVSAACAGFLYALSVGDAFVKAGSFKRVLVIGVEILTRITDWKDRNTCVLFGDGAGAVVLGPGEPGKGILSTHIYADAVGIEALNLPGGGVRHPTSAASIEQNLHTIKMNGKIVFTHAVKNLAASCQAALSANGVTGADVTMVVPHQANLRILAGVAERVGMSMDKFHINIDKYGNTSSASVPIALDEAVRDGKVKKGDLLLFCALGAGFSWGSALVRW